jgi:hypothetical protein
MGIVTSAFVTSEFNDTMLICQPECARPAFSLHQNEQSNMAIDYIRQHSSNRLFHKNPLARPEHPHCITTDVPAWDLQRSILNAYDSSYIGPDIIHIYNLLAECPDSVIMELGRRCTSRHGTYLLLLLFCLP